MTVKELIAALTDCPEDMLIGAQDQNDETCEVQFAGVISDQMGRQYFMIRANGGYTLFDRQGDGA